jgi:hypothetical protein
MSFLNRILKLILDFFRSFNDTPQPVVASPRVTKTNLNKLTKAELADKGSELGISVNLRDKKNAIVNEVYTAQKK